MGWTVLYIAFGIVALWLLGEVLLQYKARLRWRLLAFVGFLGVVFGVWDRTRFQSRMGPVLSARCWTASLKMCPSSSSRTGSTGSRPAARLPRGRSCQSWSDSFRFQTSQFHRLPAVRTCSVARAPPPMGCALPIWGLPR